MWTLPYLFSVSWPILKNVSTDSSVLIKVTRALSSPVLGDAEVAGVKKVSNPCILKILACSLMSNVSWTQIMLGECQ